MSRLHSISAPGQAEPGVGFEQPFDMLAACHDRVRRSLALLQRLLAHWPAHGADAMARSAAADVWRYFEIAAPQHHLDEERHVLPRLAASTDPALREAAAGLLADHAAFAALWATQRAHHRERKVEGGHGTSAPLPTLRLSHSSPICVRSWNQCCA